MSSLNVFSNRFDAATPRYKVSSKKIQNFRIVSIIMNKKSFMQLSLTPGPLSHCIQPIELDLNRGVSPFGPIKRQDTKIGGCHLAFFPITIVQGRGLNSESSLP